jgi:MFS family permease
MHSALFSWLLVVELDSTPERVGFGQLAVMLPTLALILIGGSVADRSDVRRALIAFHIAAALGPLGLAWLVGSGGLSYELLLIYGLWVGVVTAFIMPARDTLLSRVAGDDMLRAVAGMTIVQFAAQAAGNLLAGAARWVGGAPMLVFQGAILALGALLTARVPPAPPRKAVPPRGSISAREVLSGVTIVVKNPQLRASFAISFGVAFFFAGPFYVVFPLIVRDVYGGGVLMLSVTMMMFPLGTIAGSVAIRSRGGLRQRGPAALWSVLCGACTLGIIGLGLPFSGMLAMTVLWGLSASIFINATRTLFQEAAPEAERGRVLSVFQMALMGASPMGSFLAGICAARLGHHATLLLFAGAVFLLVSLLWVPVRRAEPVVAFSGETR